MALSQNLFIPYVVVIISFVAILFPHQVSIHSAKWPCWLLFRSQFPFIVLMNDFIRSGTLPSYHLQKKKKPRAASRQSDGVKQKHFLYRSI